MGYDVELPDCNITPITAIAIAQAMNAQCNMDRNEYLLLECFIDIEKDNMTINLEEQKVVHNDREYLQCTTLGWHGKMVPHDRRSSPSGRSLIPYRLLSMM